MQQVQIADQVYMKAKRRADEAGFNSVDEYIADLLANDVNDSAEDLDHFFTPERLVHIGEAEAQIKAGEYRTSAQVYEHFKERFGE